MKQKPWVPHRLSEATEKDKGGSGGVGGVGVRGGDGLKEVARTQDARTKLETHSLPSNGCSLDLG